MVDPGALRTPTEKTTLRQQGSGERGLGLKALVLFGGRWGFSCRMWVALKAVKKGDMTKAVF